MLNRLLVFLALLILPVAASAQGVVSAAEPRAAEAGREILRAGGSAADAAMAMMLALTVVEPQSSGIGGGGFLLHQNASGRLETIDGREKAPASAGPGRFLGPDGKPMPFGQAVPGGYSVGVPGNIALMAMTHRKWGKLPWKRLFDPAIRLAELGFTVSPRLAQSIAGSSRRWADFPAIRQLYTDAQGQPLKAGAMLRNPDLAASLRLMAEKGPDAFYKGVIASNITAAVANAARNPTTLTAEDLAAYRAKERPPVCAAYRDRKVCSMGPPSSGATTMLQILGMIERFDLKGWGPKDPRSWHVIAEATKLAYADREKWLGDADFTVVPVKGLLDPAYIAQRSQLISPDKTLAAYPAGNPPGAPARPGGAATQESGTTHFVAVDRAGNIASMTSTVESSFGSQLLASGFVLNNELTDFAFVPQVGGVPVANAVQPGKRPLSSMSPAIVYDAGGKPVLALGSAGGKRIIMHVTKTVIGFVDFGLPAGEAIALPNIYFSNTSTLVESDTFLAGMSSDLARLGELVVASNLTSKVNAAERTAAGWRGAADPRGDGLALPE